MSVVGLSLTILFVACILWYWFRQQGRRAESPPALSEFQKLALRPDASLQIKSKLIYLCDGNEELAEEIVAKVRFGHPGKSENFYWWQAISAVENGKIRVQHNQDDA
ncbi:MAG: hypothetical protein AAGF24_09600 [Cyanobacteria bacterium P01_H01_bin.121]